MHDETYLEPDQTARVEQLIQDGEIWTLDDLRTALARDGMFVDAERLRATLAVGGVAWTFADGQYACTRALLDGVVLTHRLTAAEVAASILGDRGGIEPWMVLADEGLPLAGGGEARARYAMNGPLLADGPNVGLQLPDASLDAFEAGDLLALRFVAGKLHLAKAELDNPAAEAELALIVATADRLIAEAEEAIDRGDEDEFSQWEPEPEVGVADIVLTYRRQHRNGLQQPLPPLLEVLTQHFAYEQLAFWHHGWAEGESEPGEEGWRLWLRLARAVDGGINPDPHDLVELALGLVDLTTQISLDLPTRPGGRELLRLVADTEFAARQPPVQAAVLTLRSVLADTDGDTATRKQLLDEAVALDPAADLAHGLLADLTSIAGDAAEATRLYRAAGLNNQDVEIVMLRDYLSPPTDGPGRNKPCPCGSGKKYKVCHARTATHPLPGRAPWLGFKVKGYAHHPKNAVLSVNWACALTGTSPDVALRAAYGHPLLDDLLLFGSGLLARFRSEFAGLLPADEDALLAEWGTSRRHLLEVAGVRLGAVTVTDLLTDEVYELTDWKFSRGVSEKDVLFARIVADGDGGVRLFAEPLLIPRLGRGPLLSFLRGDPTDEQVARFFAPKAPVITNQDGHELVDCIAQYRLADLEEVWPALRARLRADRDSGDDPTVIEVVDDQSDVIIGWVRRRSDDRLRVHTNSLERLRELQATVLQYAPQATLISESSTPVDLSGDLPPALPGSDQGAPLDPENLPAQARDQIIERYTATWLSSNIPALGGLTPVEAAQGSDCDRRELAALLDDFEWEQRRRPGPFDLDIAGLRASLGML